MKGVTEAEGFVEQVARLTRNGECPHCYSRRKTNRACPDHERHEQNGDDAIEALDSLVRYARRLNAKQEGRSLLHHLRDIVQWYAVEQFGCLDNDAILHSVACVTADLRHICDQYGYIDFGRACDIGYSHYCEENGQKQEN